MEQYIPKSALVAGINQRIEDYKSHKIDDSYHDGLIFALEDLRDNFIDTLKVKEVDLEKEQMMANATEVTVHIDAGGYPYTPEIELYDYDKDMPLAKEGDKYKVVLIKED